MSRLPRLAVVTSHPIQYQAPWFRALAQVTDLEVFFCHRQDAAGQAAAGFGVAFEWDVPLLDGYRHTWLENRARRPDVSSFSGCDTPDIHARLREGRFDACIVSGWYLKSYLQTIWACNRLGIPVLSRGDSQLGTARSPFWRAVKHLPYRWLLSRLDAHLYVGVNNRAYLEHYGVPGSRLFFSPHFVDNEFFASRAAAARADGRVASLRHDLGLRNDACVFAFAGKLIDKKRPADFIQALKLARTANPRIQGMVIGSGPLRGDIETLAASLDVPVAFAGFRNQTEIPVCFAAADAVVLPSDAGETWGLVVNEAMACGLPAVVSTSVGCGSDLVEEGRTGTRFPTGDIGGFSESLIALTSRLSSGREAMTAAVLARVAQYTCAAAVRGVMTALESVARSAAKSHD